MPYLRSPKDDHRCKTPSASKAIHSHGQGALWQCWKCKKKWVLVDDQKVGPCWVEEKKRGQG